MTETAPFWMKFKAEWQESRKWEGRGMMESFIRAMRFARTNITWDMTTE